MSVFIGPYVHRIDPILVEIAGVHMWWYGLSYALGFLNVLAYVTKRRHRMGLTSREAWSLCIVFAVSVLVGGRTIEVAFDEWPFYRDHLRLVPWLWLGGMATHGLLLGAAAGVAIFARLWNKPFMAIADELVVPGAILMGL